jgi:hypothetical protein
MPFQVSQAGSPQHSDTGSFNSTHHTQSSTQSASGSSCRRRISSAALSSGVRMSMQKLPNLSRVIRAPIDNRNYHTANNRIPALASRHANVGAALHRYRTWGIWFPSS